MIENIDKFFIELERSRPETYDVDELIVIIESIIPVHVNLLITDYEEVDTLLAIYPYFFQKMARVYAYFSHKVRIASQNKKTVEASNMRNYRDAFEELMRAVRLQYESLSRRITVLSERRQ
jgi:hypothetical protein